MKSILIVLLGCNILNILHDRVNTSIKFVNSIKNSTSNDLFNDLRVDWFLTGGLKDQNNDQNIHISKIKSYTEAELMLEQLKKNNLITDKSNFIIDDNSTNTVENFVFLNKYLKSESFKYDSIYVVTSDFHYERANIILSKIIPNNNFKWILGLEETNNIRFWEKYHINNIDRDIQTAMINHKFTIYEN